MIVSYSRRATRDLEDILHYLSERSPGGAHNVSRSIAAAIEFLADNPGIGIKTNRTEVRVRIMAEYPYKIFYRVRKDIIEVVHIRHGARRIWGRT